ncbi:MAG TPA: 16S rRNA (guanine(966)-N(2))-methyltransferase RsmD [Geobacteraceae bacterium]|nr:16S rRNA (guanine(966)-N(2))-methyltransferase RsmD [Geobacteraceae bacterium]
MRIISGSGRGRRLHSPPNMRVRPTADRVKESLFNILSVLLGSFEGLRVLDIFAGTGSLGIEALSRGAVQAVFIDNHKGSVVLIEKNLGMLGFAGNARVLERDVLAGMRSLERKGAPFNLVFLDPPYRQGLAERTLGYLADSMLIDENSLVVAELSSGEAPPAVYGSLREFDRRVYGDTMILFFRRAHGEQPGLEP